MKEPREYIVFPLDLPTYDQAMFYVERLKDLVGLFKVGLELFVSQGPGVLKSIHEEGSARIFLDLKFHDIPATIKRALLAVGQYSPEFVTVHCDEGGGVLKSIVEAAPEKIKILAVTVLTSLSPSNLSALGYAEKYQKNLSQLVLLKARMAKEAGCQGVVCSGHEVAMVKEELGKDLIAVTPGIRPEWAIVGGDDQKRIVTPRAAIQRGADYIVVGRPIRDAKNPADAARRVADEVASAL